MPFLEDEFGVPVDGDMALAIMSFARDTWASLLRAQILPLRWTDPLNDPRARKYYFSELENKFEVLTLCSDHWKAKKICTKHFPSWLQNQGRRGIVKAQPWYKSTHPHVRFKHGIVLVLLIIE
jgi:hypothetical protein